jgi:hypothetical protein
MKLIQISAFYKNDHPNGIGITLTEEFGDLDQFLEIIQTSYKAMWQESEQNSELPTLILELRGQLISLGLKKGDIGIHAGSIVIGNVWLLESHGQMITDEFNGLQLAYVE